MLRAGKTFFYASVPGIAVAGGAMLSGLSVRGGVISQGHLEGISANLAQMSIWTQG